MTAIKVVTQTAHTRMDRKQTIAQLSCGNTKNISSHSIDASPQSAPIHSYGPTVIQRAANIYTHTTGMIFRLRATDGGTFPIKTMLETFIYFQPTKYIGKRTQLTMVYLKYRHVSLHTRQD